MLRNEIVLGADLRAGRSPVSESSHPRCDIVCLQAVLVFVASRGGKLVVTPLCWSWWLCKGLTEKSNGKPSTPS